MNAACTAKAEYSEKECENNELALVSAQIRGENAALLIRTDVFVQWAVAEVLARTVEKRIDPADRKLKGV